MSGASRAATGQVVGQSRSERFQATERRILAVSHLMDEAVAVPGTEFRFGLDPVVGLVPWVGDILSAAVGLWIIVEAARFDVPRVVLARMVLNTVVDLLVGLVPVVGDALDFVSRSNRANVELFRRHAADPSAPTGDHARFFIGLALLALGLLWLLAQTASWLLSVRVPAP